MSPVDHAGKNVRGRGASAPQYGLMTRGGLKHSKGDFGLSCKLLASDTRHLPQVSSTWDIAIGNSAILKYF